MLPYRAMMNIGSSVKRRAAMTVPPRRSDPNRSWIDVFEKVIDDLGRTCRCCLLWLGFGLVVVLLVAILAVPVTMVAVLRPTSCGSVLRPSISAVWRRVRR